MTATRIYTPDPIDPGGEVVLDDTASRHLLRVLRCRVGEPVVLFNGDGNDYAGAITVIDGRRAVVVVESSTASDTESPLRITLGQAMSRGQRFEFTIQKAVELGVTCIVPLSTERSAALGDKKRSNNRLQRWQQIAVSAAEQCGRSRITTIQPPMALNDWLLLDRSGATPLVLDPTSSGRLSDLSPRGEIKLLVGPEGGLSDDEIERATQAGFQGIRIGPRILRTETAGPAAIAALQLLAGDF